MQSLMVSSTRCCLILFVLVAAGCGAKSSNMRVWGQVTYQDKPVERGQIIFKPIEGTKGPSTGGPITDGKYDIIQPHGPLASGTYRVEITAYGPERTYAPSADGKGLTATVPTQYLPAKFNRNSTLKVTIAVAAAENEKDYRLAP